MSSSSVLMVYVTCRDGIEADALARALLERRLIACANILPAHTSLYRWEGAVQEAAEVSVLLKTTAARFDAVRAEILARHSYECPCIVAWPVSHGHVGFLDWVASETDQG